MKVFLSILVFISLCFGDAFDDGVKAAESGDLKKAIELFTLATNQGNADAQYNLGVMYANGQGLKQDYKKAKDLFGKACDAGIQLGCDYYKDLNQKGY